MNLFSKKEVFECPVNGKVMKLENVQDEVFSKKVMGDGIAIEPVDGKIYAPFTGKLEVCFPTGHAYGIKAKNGLEVLIHLGIDTVDLEGEGFTMHVKQGDRIKQGQLLCTMDLEKIKKMNRLTTVIIVFTSGESVEVITSDKDIIHGDNILRILG